MIEIVMISFGFLMFPISEHSFTLKAAKRLFLARTNDKDMFVYTDADKKLMTYDEIDNPELRKEL